MYEEFVGYGIMPVGGGVNVVISSTLAGKGGAPKALPATFEEGAPANPRIVAVGSVEQALELGTQPEADKPRSGEVCLVLGGERIYTETLPRADFLRLCHIRQDFEGGINFPKHEETEWTAVNAADPNTETNKVDGKPLEFQIVDYVRAANASSSTLAPHIEALAASECSFRQADWQGED